MHIFNEHVEVNYVFTSNLNLKSTREAYAKRWGEVLIICVAFKGGRSLLDCFFLVFMRVEVISW